MSYNCTTWRTKELVDLRIPFKALYVSDVEGWRPNRVDGPGDTVTLDWCDSIIEGQLVDGILAVTSLRIAGEGSGACTTYVLIPAFKQSTGRLVAARVWEGGDSIDRLTVDNGHVSVENIEL